MKQVQVGPVLLQVAMANGVVSLSGSASGALGGGQAAGVLSANASAGLQLSAQQAADLVMAILEEALPSASGLLKMVQTGLDAELSSLSI